MQAHNEMKASLHGQSEEPLNPATTKQQDSKSDTMSVSMIHSRNEKSHTKIDPNRLLRLVFCASGICGCYISYGILQEKLYKNQTLGASFILFTQCVTNVLVSSIWILIQQLFDSHEKSRPFQKEPLPHGWLIVTACCYSIAMVCSNEAVRYVSYPIQVLAKSCKLIPTMMVGQFVDRRTSYGQTEWYAALLICSGIVLFHATKLANGSSSSSSTSTRGSLLLLASLTMDGFLSSFQNRVKQCAHPPNAAFTMFSINFYALFLLYGMCHVSGQWDSAMVILQRNEWTIVSSLGILNATVGLGQIFIFLTIDWFTPVTTTIITTSRKFLTIVISAILYSHGFTQIQWVAIVTVFTGLYMAILGTVTKKQKVD